MSKNRNNVKYSLFMSDPVPHKNTKISSHNNKNTDLFIKGKNDVTFELKKGYDNIYIVKNLDNKRIEFDRNGFSDILKELKKYAHTPITILEDTQKQDFSKVMSAIGTLQKTGKLYDLIHDDIENAFHDVKIVIPGTIAAYFIGCSSNDNFPGPMGCNPKCAASLVPGGKDPVEYGCDDLVLMYEDDGTFSSLYRKISQHAYIYIGNSNFKGFTEDNIKKLNEANISSATLTYGKTDGTYADPINAMSINELPLISQTENKTITSDDNGAWILFIIIIVIIIILLLIMLYQLYANKNF